MAVRLGAEAEAVRVRKPVKRKILRSDQSPMNPLRWQLTLEECKHEIWVTQKAKPKEGKPVNCTACAAQRESVAQKAKF